MALEDLGNIGEFISALAVVISLLYLAVQIRQNTRSLRASAHQSITSNIAELNRSVVEHPEVANILEVGLVDIGALSPEERRRFSAYDSARFRHHDNPHYQFRTGTLEDSQWKGFENLLRSHLAQPGVARWWREATPFYSAEFVAYVGSLRRNDTRTPEREPAGPDDAQADGPDLW